MKLSHRGLNVWISSDKEEQDIYVWSPPIKNVNNATRKVNPNADRVAGYIAVEEGQRLRVNVESDGSLGAIAIFLSVDGVPLHGPFLKGKGTAWMDGVSCAPKSGMMSGRFCIEYTSYEARRVEKNRKYHGAIGVLVRFLRPCEGSPGDEDDDDIEVLDNIDFPDTWRGSYCQDPESSLRIGIDGESEGERKFPTYHLKRTQSQQAPVEFLFKYHTLEYLQANGYKLMRKKEMELESKKPSGSAPVAAPLPAPVAAPSVGPQKRKASEEDTIATAPKAPVKKPRKGKQREGTQPETNGTNAPVDIGSLPAVGGSLHPAGTRSSPSESAFVLNPPIVPSQMAVPMPIAHDATVMPTHASNHAQPRSAPTATHHVTQPAHSHARFSGAPGYNGTLAFDAPAQPYGYPARGQAIGQAVPLRREFSQHSHAAAMHRSNFIQPPPHSIQSATNIDAAQWALQPPPRAPSRFAQSHISGVVHNDTETSQLHTGEYALLQGQQLHNRPMYPSQAPAPAWYEQPTAFNQAGHPIPNGVQGIPAHHSGGTSSGQYSQPHQNSSMHGYGQPPLGSLPLEYPTNALAGPSNARPLSSTNTTIQRSTTIPANAQPYEPPVQMQNYATGGNDLPDEMAALLADDEFWKDFDRDVLTGSYKFLNDYGQDTGAQ